MRSYTEIKEWLEDIQQDELGIRSLNGLYDRAMIQVIRIALKKYPEPPCHFAWFVIGSGGRRELVPTSDQDHGIMYREDGHERYFQQLGQEIADGLHQIGFSYCDGGVMASERAWCRSLNEWQKQLMEWYCSDDITATRHLQMLYDLRIVYGDKSYEQMVKNWTEPQSHEQLEKYICTTTWVKKSMTPLGKLILEKSKYFDFKNAVYVPYINSRRLQKMAGMQQDCKLYDAIMEIRMTEPSFVEIQPSNRKAIKELVKSVRKLHNDVREKIGIGCS